MAFSLCKCFKQLTHTDNAIEEILKIRADCEALKLIIPDTCLNDYVEFLKTPLDEARHQSMPFLAYKKGRLSLLTRPVHFLLDKSKELNLPIINQYRRDLEERWLFAESSKARYERAKRFQSRFIELGVAELLSPETKVIGLEALGADFDILTESNSQMKNAVEVKFIAQEQAVFSLVVDAIQKSCAVTVALDIDAPYDYLLYRIYEAATQLQAHNGQRTVAAVVNDYELSYQIGLEAKWINWDRPQFKKTGDILPFLEQQYSRNANLDIDLITQIRSLNEIRIYAVNRPSEISLMHIIPCAGEA